MTATVKTENGISVVTMDDGKANAISLTMLEAVNACLDEAEKAGEVLVLTGRPDRFSAGFDLKFMASAQPEDVRRLVVGGGKLAMRLFTAKMPVVVASTGHAIAMGAFLLLGGDTRISARGAYKIGANETVNGMTLPGFATELPRHRLNPMYLTEALVQARLYTPDEALPVGWVDRVVEPEALMDAAMEEATRLKAIANGAYYRNKMLVRQPAVDAILPTLEGSSI